ncbi:MAG TPA: hypothetical protein VH062_33285 [Polyangiaceae bacterium]|jgi:hypothetical protein|nr:hypothetical protein [Polyangiaceae bacterium]
MRLFAPDGDQRNYDQPSLDFDKIIALTATPFELTPHELVNLLALVKADNAVLDTIEAGLQNFVQALDRFFELRERSPMDPLRQQQVTLLQRLRDEDALKSEGTDQRCLRRCPNSARLCSTGVDSRSPAERALSSKADFVSRRWLARSRAA